jgi:DNA repair protein RadC
MNELLEGHRARLKTRLIQSNLGSVADYEILELILCLAIPRKDMKSLAKMLINKFGSLGKALNADPSLLVQISGVGPSVISTFRLFREVIASVTKEQITNDNIFSSWDKMIEYVRSTMGYNSTEQLRVLFLNNKNMLLADELQDYGTISSISIYPREIVKKAIYHSASAIILIHNHPSGSTKPSKSDLELTEITVRALSAIDVKLLDHVIVSSSNHYSFKANRLIN